MAVGGQPQLDLRADCARCFGLCCVAPAFAASADFAIDKPAGRACPHLQPTFACEIHDRLRERGFPGCAAYDCFGAGQAVAQRTFAGRDWRSAPATAGLMFAAFATMRQLHELLWLLREALGLPAAASLRAELQAALAAIAALTEEPADALVALDVGLQRELVNPLLVRASEVARLAGAGRLGADRRGAELTAADLRGADLRGASLRGALLLGADLRRADLAFADLTGADLRAADLRGTDLRSTLFVSQAQLDTARGDAATRLPPARLRPAHW